MGKSLEQFKSEFNQFDQNITQYIDTLNQGFTNKLFNDIGDRQKAADTFYANNIGVLQEQFERIINGPKSSDRDKILEWAVNNQFGLSILENESLCDQLKDKGILEIRNKTANLRKTINGWINLYKNNMDQLINPDGTDNFSNAETGSPQEKAKQIRNTIEVFCAIPNRARTFLWEKGSEEKQRYINDIIDSKERKDPIFDVDLINGIASENPYDTQLQIKCMKAMKKLQPYYNSDPMFKAFAENSIGHEMMKSVLQKGEAIVKQQNGIESFEKTEIEQDKEYINKLLDIKGKNIDPIAAVNAISVIANKYSEKNKNNTILSNCKNAVGMLLPLAGTDKEFEKFALSKDGSNMIREIYKKGGLAEDRKAEKSKETALFNAVITNPDFYEDLQTEAQKASGTFHDSQQYKNFRTMTENYASLANEVYDSWEMCSGDKGKFSIELDELSPKAKSLAFKLLGKEETDDISLDIKQTFKLLKKFDDSLKAAAKAYEEYKMEDHTLDPEKDPDKKILNKDDIKKINLVRRVRGIKPLPENLYKKKENNIEKDTVPGI